MTLRSTLLASAFGLGLAFAAGQAAAIPFEGTFTVNAWTDTDHGLAIQTTPHVAAGHATGVSNGFQFDLANVGDSVSFRLFDIWTDEGTVNFGEDDVGRPISVDFSFLLPPPAFGGTANGTTVGGFYFNSFNEFGERGEVDWNNPTLLNFGALGDGVLRVSLEDEAFNAGNFVDFEFGLIPGQDYGANVKVKFKLLAKATEVPEPASLALLGMGLIGLGAIRRRKAA